MTYTHTGKAPAIFRSDPIDPNSTDWVYFVYDSWLRPGEQIIAHSALITGGTIVTDSTFLGEMVDESGTLHTQTFGIEIGVETGSSTVTVTHRVTTQTQEHEVADLGRVNIDHSVIIPVVQL